MDIEDIQAEEHYEALEDLTDKILDAIEELVNNEGGNGKAFVHGLCRKEIPSIIIEDLHFDMPSSYGVKTISKPKVYHQSTIDDITRHI